MQTRSGVVMHGYRSSGNLPGVSIETDGMDATPAEESDLESPDAEGQRKPRSSSITASKVQAARSPQPVARSHLRTAMNSATPVPSQERVHTADMSPAPSASSMPGKRRSARTGSPCDSPKPAGAHVQVGPSSGSTAEDTRKDRSQLNRSSTTPSLRSNVELRSKSRGTEGKAKETRNDRPEGRSGQAVPAQEQPHVDAKSSPQQAFRVLPGRFSAPPTPRRHTPRAPKRTPRLSPRATFPQQAQVKGKDPEEIRRQAQAQAWERDREDRLRRQRISEIDARAQRLNSDVDVRGQVSKGHGLSSSTAVDSARSTTSASTPAAVLVRPTVVAPNSLQAGHPEEDVASSTMPPASTPPMPVSGSHASGNTAVDACVDMGLMADQHVGPFYQNGIALSGTETASDSSDLPVPRVRGDGKQTHAQSVVDNSRIMRLIGRRSVLSQPNPVLGPPHQQPQPQQQQVQPQQQQVQPQQQQVQPPQQLPQQQPQQPQQQQPRQQRNAPPRNSVPGSPNSPPKPEIGVRGHRVSSGAAAVSAAAAQATAQLRAEANALAAGEPKSSARLDVEAKRRRQYTSANDENSTAAHHSVAFATSQQASAVERPADSAEMRQAFGATQVDLQPAQWDVQTEGNVESTEAVSGKEGASATFADSAAAIDTPSLSTITLLPEEEETATNQSTSTTTTQAGSHSTSAAAVSATAAADQMPVDSALQGQPAWYKDAARTDAGGSGAVIWPGRPGAKQEAAPAQTQAQPQPQSQLQAQLQMLSQYGHGHGHGHAAASGSGTTAGGSSAWGYAEQMALAESQGSYSLAANGHMSFQAQSMMQNEVGSLVMPTTWRYLQPPPHMVQTAAAEQDGTAPEAPSSPSRPSAEPSASSQAEEAAGIVIRQVGSDRDTDAPSAEEAPVLEPMDLEAKRQLLSDLVEFLTAKTAHTDQSLGSEQRANHAMRVTLEVLQRQNLHLQQQLAWVTQSWPYANMANIC